MKTANQKPPPERPKAIPADIQQLNLAGSRLLRRVGAAVYGTSCDVKFKTQTAFSKLYETSNRTKSLCGWVARDLNARRLQPSVH